MTTASPELTVVLADAQPMARRGLHALLSAATGITVVAEAGSGRDAVAAVLRHRPDVLILDLPLRDLGGAAVAREVATDTSVLVFSALDDDYSLFTALRAGVRGYLLKRAEPADVVRAVRGVAAGAAIFGADIGSRITDLLLGPAVPQPLPHLSAREREVLSLVATGAPNPAIAHQLGIAPKTVRNTVSVIITKLRVYSRAEAITVAKQAGLADA